MSALAAFQGDVSRWEALCLGSAVWSSAFGRWYQFGLPSLSHAGTTWRRLCRKTLRPTSRRNSEAHRSDHIF